MAINIAKAIAKGFSGQNGATVGFKPAVLTRYTPGIRQPGNLSGGTNPTTQAFKCRAMVISETQLALPASLLQDTDAQILILGATLPVGVVPLPTDHVTIEGKGKDFIIAADAGGKQAVVRDPVGATYIVAVT